MEQLVDSSVDTSGRKKVGAGVRLCCSSAGAIEKIDKLMKGETATNVWCMHRS